ncbi:MAG: CinA family protein [Planctomycetes bacterium]|nr:CinA family protein [Planctomycetota bacterium]MBL7042366.1 CinA family protein [Pirellulaceae bacterium]
MNVAESDIQTRCARIAELLIAGKRRVVFAESCTAGLVSALLARIPGISSYLCGSAVTYREATKVGWLDIPPAILEQHTAVSEVVTKLMASGVLAKTPEADVAAAVTGHLGPNAPPEQDGLVYVAIAVWSPDREDVVTARVAEYRLAGEDRLSRQREAAARVLECLLETLQADPWRSAQEAERG